MQTEHYEAHMHACYAYCPEPVFLISCNSQFKERPDQVTRLTRNCLIVGRNCQKFISSQDRGFYYAKFNHITCKKFGLTSSATTD